MTLIDAKNISDTYYRIINLRTFLERGRSITQAYTLTEKDREGTPITISITHEQIGALLKELDKELERLESVLNHSQIVIRPNELTMEKE